MRIPTLIRFLIVSGAALTSSAKASEIETAPESKATISHEAKAKTKKFEDRDLTDPALRATAGSLSPMSLRFNLTYLGPPVLTYLGPPVGDLSALEQPNPDGTAAVTATALTGSFGGRYRFNSRSSVSLTAGLSDQYIFHDQQRFEVNNPYLSYDRTFKVYGVQVVSSPGVAFITASALRRVGEVASVNYSLSSVYNFARERWAIGLELTAAYYLFERSWVRQDGKVRQENLGVNPSLKYNVSDKFNVYTSLAFALWNPRGQPDRTRLMAKNTVEKIGFGYGTGRDFYVTPYLSFFPEEPRLDSTTFNLSTIFSIM